MHLKISPAIWRQFCLSINMLNGTDKCKLQCFVVSNHQRLGCLLNRLFRRSSKKTSKLRVTGLCEGKPPVTGGFPSQRASKAEFFPFDEVTLTCIYLQEQVCQTTSNLSVWCSCNRGCSASYGFRHCAPKSFAMSTYSENGTNILSY